MKNVKFILPLLFISACVNRQTDQGIFNPEGRKVAVYTTARDTNLRMTLTADLQFKKLESTSERQVYIFVDPSKTDQEFIGIGGALTDAAAETFARLPPAKQDELMQAYYSTENGIGYTFARTNINSCDFSSSSYTYVQEGDEDLKTFDVAPDRQYKIPLIKRAIAAAGGNLTLFASPWSPPAYMKDNNNMLQGGKLKPEFYSTWALYYAKFVKSYAEEGIPVWGITIQNEPMATQRWESCIYYAWEERDFLKNYLGPTMHREGLKDVKIIVWDHNRDLIIQRAQTIFNDPEASKYAWGIGFHWYEDWSGGQQMYGNVAYVHQFWPDKHLIFTEGTPASFNPERYNSWKLGEDYGISMIHDFNSGAVAWTDWNILLDERGGPNHVGNFCFAPVHADTRTGELIYTNSFWYIGHFSKYIRPGAKRIPASSSRSTLLTTAFINQDGKIAVVVMNPIDRGTRYNLCINSFYTEAEILPHSIQTLVF